MMNRKGFELSINFIVMLILAIAVFGFGLYFIQKVFTQAGEIKAQLDKDSEARVALLLDRGDKVAFPVTSKDVKSSEGAVFGLGVLNVRDDKTTFFVDVVCSTYLSKGNVEDQTKCSGKWTFSITPFTLDKNERKIIPIAIQPPSGKPTGTYAFTVTVHVGSSNGPVYGDAPKQIYINII